MACDLIDVYVEYSKTLMKEAKKIKEKPLTTYEVCQWDPDWGWDGARLLQRSFPPSRNTASPDLRSKSCPTHQHVPVEENVAENVEQLIGVGGRMFCQIKHLL